ncbi:MAG: DUF58 domain-containing protein [Phycisphaerales bacterium]|nr:DUF58 domain-containing protein [Phycisphaerales bacterium]
MTRAITDVAGVEANASRPRVRLERVDDLIDGALMARLDTLDVVSRKIFAGKVRGERKSRRRGQSVEFADYRPYVAGDDLRFVDWNIFGRLDRLFLKLFLEEEDLTLAIAIDTSASMDLGTPNKFDFARRLAMALGYIGLVNHNRVALYAFGGEGLRPLTGMRGRRRTSEMGRWLLQQTCEGDAQFESAMRTIALGRHGKGVLVVLSDFLFPTGFEKGLRSLVGRGYDLHAMQLLSSDEIDPARYGLSGDLRLVDSESRAETEVTAGTSAIEKYRERLAQHCAELRDFSIRRGITHSVVDTAADMDALVIEYLRRRGMLR